MEKHIVLELSKNEINLALLHKKDVLFFRNYFINEINDIKNIIIGFKKEHKISTKKIMVILKTNEIFKKFENLPLTSKKEIKKYFENSDKIFPFDKNETIMDYEIIKTKKEGSRVMFVAMQKNRILTLLDLIKEIKLDCIKIDFFQNTVSKYFLKSISDETFIISSIDEKISLIYIKDNELIGMREVVSGENFFQIIGQAFGFYKSEMHKLKKVFFINENQVLENLFNEHSGLEIYKNADIQAHFGIESEKLAMYGLI